ncbi:MAG: hypothetical protein IJ801_01515 [Lachnospiraceae bacterium]|nr:hypothetical protein [Lachnospiraceae bacterium]
MHEFADILTSDPNEPLKVQMDVAAIDPNDDVRHFSFAFAITNRDLQFETKEIPIDHQVQMEHWEMYSG